MTELIPEARADIQGIILSGYGHLNYASYLFIQVQDATKAKMWLKKIIPETTTAEPWKQRPDGTKEKPETAVNIMFTYQGFKVLGLSQQALDTFSREFIEGIATPKRSELLGDTHENVPDKWDVGGTKNPEVHIFLMVYGLDAAILQKRCNELLSDNNNGIVVVAQEDGARPNTLKEHFGFHDGISQPKIEFSTENLKPDPSVVKAGEFILGYPDEYNTFPPTPTVLIQEDANNLLPGFPGTEMSGLKDFGRNGTYIVYRKMAQNVAGFWQFIAQETIGSDGSPNPEQMKMIAAKFVGRWPSGTPLVLAPEQDDPQMKEKNDFKYLPEDKDGYACPLGAHIRRSNPRDSLEGDPKESLKTSNRHRLLRRGIPYGAPLFPLDDIENGKLPLGIEDDGQPRGLHFLSINANIERQFEFVQQTWINNPKFSGLYDNKDPIMGNNDGSTSMTIQRQPIRKQINNLPSFVTVKGGGYFFIPSLSAMRFLVNTV